MIEELIDRIAAKACEMGGRTAGHGDNSSPVVNLYYSPTRAEALRGYPSWTASVEVKAPRKPNRWAYGKGHDIEQAVKNLAKEVGL